MTIVGKLYGARGATEWSQNFVVGMEGVEPKAE